MNANDKAFLTLEVRCLHSIIDAPTDTEKLAAIFALEEGITAIKGLASVDNLPPRVVTRLKLIPQETPWPDRSQIDAANARLFVDPIPFTYQET